MTASDPSWEQVKELFAAVLDQPESLQLPYLASRCTDEKLAEQVRRLVVLERNARSFLSHAIGAPEPQLVAELEPGQVLANRYRIEHLLGLGGMSGGVYSAMDLEHGVRVALKTMKDTREFLLARNITHPNLCRVFDCTTDAQLRFITMELLDGETLDARIRRAGPLHNDELKSLGVQLCAGLAAAHAGHILHRDLKPSNIFLTSSGRVVIADFGLARSISENPSASVHLMGTLPYMAPEILAGRPATIRSDIYSLGVVLHEAATGKLPCDLAAAPFRFRGLIEQCLRREPTLRPQSADLVGTALASIRLDFPRWLPISWTRLMPDFAAVPASGLRQGLQQ